jgi:hypothetical protein
MKTQATGAALEAMFQFTMKTQTQRLVLLLCARELA